MAAAAGAGLGLALPGTRAAPRSARALTPPRVMAAVSNLSRRHKSPRWAEWQTLGSPLELGGSGLSKDGARLFACCNLHAAAFRVLLLRVRPWSYFSVKL